MIDYANTRAMDRLISEHLFAMSLLFGTIPTGSTCNKPDLKWVRTGTPVNNRIFGARFTEQEMAARVSETTALLHTGQAVVHWILDPESRPAGLGHCLRQHGWEELEPWTGMALPAATPMLPVPLPNGVTIGRVTDDATLRLWAKTFISDIAATYPDRATAFIEIFSALGHGPHLPWIHFLAYLHEEPVATGLLLLHQGVAGLYWIKTIAAARRRGIGRSLTREMTVLARTMEYPLVVLQATAVGRSIYRPLGFLDYGQMTRYEISTARR